MPRGATPAELPPARAESPAATRALIVCLVLGALYVGREVFVPCALALLLSVVLVPPTTWLERIGLPRVPAVLLVLLLAAGAIGSFLLLLAAQAMSLAADLPRYEFTLREKLRSLSDGSGVLGQALGTIQRLSEELTRGGVTAAEAPAAVPAAAAPTHPSPFAALLDLAGYILPPLASLAIAMLLVGYLLVQREDVRDRFLRLAGNHDLHRSTRAMADATERVGRYLLNQVVVNLAFGAGMAAGLSAIGVPNALFWGLVGFVLRFVPFLGAWISMLFPLAVAFLTGTGWTQPLLVIAVFAAVDGLCTYVLEPWLYGSSVGISPLALLISSALWTVLWGPVGLLLAPAITACLVILGRHVPGFGFLEVMLGSTEALPPTVRFYQRLVAHDRTGAEAVALAHVQERGIPATLRELVLPALAALRDDYRAGLLRGGEAARLAEATAEILQALPRPGGGTPPEDGTQRPCAVIPLAGALDAAAAAMVAARLASEGQPARLGPAAGDAAATVLVGWDPPSPTRLRRALGLAAGSGGRRLALLLDARGETDLGPGVTVLRDLDALPSHLGLAPALERVGGGR